jgi:hypothetical protein
MVLLLKKSLELYESTFVATAFYLKDDRNFVIGSHTHNLQSLSG